VPQKTAIIDGERKIIFKELVDRSRRLSFDIFDKVNSFNKPIAVFLPKSIESVVSDLAIIYSGNFYMNLDIKSPVIRIQNIIDQIKPRLIITNSESLKTIELLKDVVHVINIDFLDNDSKIDEERLHRNLKYIIDTDPLCIINTSGSTGTPKGVVLNHKSFIDFTEWAIDTLNIDDNEIIGSLSPIVFDIYSFELCTLMSKGSTLVLIPEHYSPFPIKILEILFEAEVNFIFWVPTIMVNIANMDLLTRIDLSKLKTIWFAGEVFPTKQFNYWKKHLPATIFVNLYGPIEITLDCTYYIVERELKDEEPIPIGFPCRNTDILILNDNNQIAGIKEEGELCVRGSSLALGYYNNPEKSGDAFVQNPLNPHYPEMIYRTGDVVCRNELGELIFKGRKDTLIKHLGYRIELGEIEHVVVNTLKLAGNGCVVYNEIKKEIILVYESPSVISVAEFRKALSSIFPKYMVPSVYHRMQFLPRNTNGKIDRRLLKEKFMS
jgi:amino acid adenylation domain-containing protein